MRYTLKQGSKYKAYLKLTLDEMGFDNSMIRALGESIGLSSIEVWGGGSVRHVTGVWNGHTQTIDLPPEIRDIEELE